MSEETAKPAVREKRQYGKMPAKVRHFAQRYIVDLDAEKAAVAVGWAPGYGVTLMRRIDVQREIARAMVERCRRLEVKADHVLTMILTQIEQLMHADLADLYDGDVLKPVAEWPQVWRNGGVVKIRTREEFKRSRDGKVADEDGRKSWDKSGEIVDVALVNIKEQLREYIKLAGQHVNVNAFPKPGIDLGGEQPSEIIVRWGGVQESPRVIPVEASK